MTRTAKRTKDASYGVFFDKSATRIVWIRTPRYGTDAVCDKGNTSLQAVSCRCIPCSCRLAWIVIRHGEILRAVRTDSTPPSQPNKNFNASQAQNRLPKRRVKQYIGLDDLSIDRSSLKKIEDSGFIKKLYGN